MNQTTNKSQTYLGYALHALAIVNIAAFWGMYGLISFFNRFTGDDFAMISLSNSKGIWGHTLWFYYHRGGSFFVILFENITLYLLQNQTVVLVYHLLLLLFLSISIFFLAREAVKFLGLNISNKLIFFTTQFFIQALFFTSLEISHNWFWITGSSGYMYPICIFSLCIGFFLRYMRDQSVTYFFLALLFAFISGTVYVNYNIIFLAVFCLIVLLDYRHEKRIQPATASYLLAFILGAVIYFAAPGNYARLDSDHKILDPNLAQYSFGYQIVHLPVLLIEKLLSKGIFIVAFTFPIAYSVYHVLSRTAQFNFVKLLPRVCAFLAIFFLFALLSNTAILIMATGWGIHYRTMLLILILLLLFAIALTVWFLFVVNQPKYFVLLSFLTMLLGFYFNVKTALNQYPIVRRYASAHDKRIEVILEAQKNYRGEILRLDPLPPSGLLFNPELSKDTANMVNVELECRYNLPFHIALK